MGVDYHNCDVCNDIFSSCDDYNICDGCRKRWCTSCRVDQFIFNGEARCDLCWQDAPKAVKSSELLDFCCEKYKTTRKDIEKEYRVQANGDEYREPEDSFYCTMCVTRDCADTKCVRIDELCEVDDIDVDLQIKGVCCRAQIKYCGTDEDDMCDECIKWERRRSAYTLLGLRCFRPKTPLAKLPKDVLIYLINVIRIVP